MSPYDNAKVAYWLRDPFWRAVDYATYYALRSLPVAAASDIGRRLRVAAGRLRFGDLTVDAGEPLRQFHLDVPVGKGAKVLNPLVYSNPLGRPRTTAGC